jgi:hypothetical protein
MGQRMECHECRSKGSTKKGSTKAVGSTQTDSEEEEEEETTDEGSEYINLKVMGQVCACMRECEKVRRPLTAVRRPLPAARRPPPASHARLPSLVFASRRASWHCGL